MTLQKKWSGLRIQFNFMQCPLCKTYIEHPMLEQILKPLKELYQEVVSKAKLRLEYDGLIQCPAITSSNR